ncbi:MAG: penicillin-binding transpeptidase domain-containing protein, partial [Oscillospiraceae bacterium]
MSVQPTNKMKKRLNIVIMPLLLVLVGWILINLTGAALIDSKKYEAMANQQQFGSIPIHANRGTIYDVNGKTLASSNTVYNIIFDPATFRKNDEDKLDLIKKEMKELFDIPEETMQEKSEIKGSGEGYQVIKKKVDKPQADALTKFCNENDVNCLYSVQDTRRYYPQNELAANVIGFLDSDGAGQYGLEAYYDDYLAGVDGRIISAKTANGEEMPYRYQKTFDAQDGNSLYLTIDSTLQHYLEKNLSEAVTTYNVENRASGIIMNAKTGAILAMSTEPGFDLNNPAEIFDPRVNEKLGLLTPEEYKKAYPQAREQQWKNKAVTEIYYPGSVFKVVTGSAALEEKVIDTNTKFACMNMNVFGTSFHCWTKNGHGQQNFVEAMTNSCNPAFIQIGEKLGKENFTKYFEAFGLTEKTGIDLPGEVSSLYVPLERMGPVELASSSFGQTNKITPIQMITAYAATINGGYLVTPYITSKITDNNGNVIKSNETEIKRQVISEETSAIMRSTLESVVNVKGESNANIKGYRIGGKSGTSEKQDENIQQKRDDLYVSSYVGFTPA